MTTIMASGIEETITVLKTGTVLEIRPQDRTYDFRLLLNDKGTGRFSIFRDEARFPSGYNAAKYAPVTRMVEGETPDGEPVIRVYGIPADGEEEVLLVSLN